MNTLSPSATVMIEGLRDLEDAIKSRKLRGNPRHDGFKKLFVSFRSENSWFFSFSFFSSLRRPIE